MIEDGRPFVGPVELIHHHSRFLDGFVTKPTIPCQRPPDVAPLAWPGFTMLELEVELLEEAKKTGIKKVCRSHNCICDFSRPLHFYYRLGGGPRPVGSQQISIIFLLSYFKNIFSMSRSGQILEFIKKRTLSALDWLETQLKSAGGQAT